jgi:hypothetical protein
VFSINRFSVMLLSFASVCAAADTLLWEPGTVVAVDQVSTPAKEPDPSCRTLPRGTTPPAKCRPSYLRAEQFWRVTVEVGNKRLVVRPYRAPALIAALNQDGPDYVDPKLTVASSVEVAIWSNKEVRLRTDQGQGIPALVDSQEFLSSPAVQVKAAAPPSPRPKTAAPAPVASSSSRVVLLESSDFLDLEVQEFEAQDIGDGAAIYSFKGDSSPNRVGSHAPVFLVLAEGETTTGGNVELARLQVGKGTRQLAYSAAKNHSASSVPVVVTQVSATLRKVSPKDPLPAGEYVVLLENSRRGFLFQVR